MIQIGDYIFPANQAQALVRREEVHSLVRKSIRIDTLLGPFDSIDEAQNEIENLEGELARADAGLADVRIQEGRYYRARRSEYTRTLDERTLTAAIHMTLLTDDPFERSVNEHSIPWTITASGAQITIPNAGNVDAPPLITLTASSYLINPTLSDGVRNWTYLALLNAGDFLVIDSDRKTALLNGTVNILHTVDGEFIQLPPGNTVLIYTDYPYSSHQAIINIQYQDCWD